MLTFVVGTRPEAIKVGPVIAECKKLGISTRVIHTGQHTSLFDQVGLTADEHWGLTLPADPDRAAETIVGACRDRLPIPGSFVVQGDTTSAYGAALFAEENGQALYHIEAGVRSGNRGHPWPEEDFRVTIDRAASGGACATSGNLQHLTAEWLKGTIPDRPDARFLVTGNPGVDACLATQGPVPIEERATHVVVTLHRRESFGTPLEDMVEGLTRAALAGERRFYWPVHPNPAVTAVWMKRTTGALTICKPLDHGPFLHLLATATCVITDSGGVQEDAATLGIPCLVAREVTDRPESVESGQALVVGRTAEGILNGLERVLAGELSREPSTVFGDGKAAPQIAQHLQSLLD